MFSRFIHVVTDIRALFLLWLNNIRTIIHFKLYFCGRYKLGVQLCCFTGSDSKDSVCNAGDMNSISGLGGSPGEGNGYALQCSCLENPMDRGAWWATVHEGHKESDMTEWLSMHAVISFLNLKVIVGPSILYATRCSTWRTAHLCILEHL